MSTQNVNVSRFAHNVEWDFFCDFQTPCCVLFKLKLIQCSQHKKKLQIVKSTKNCQFECHFQSCFEFWCIFRYTSWPFCKKVFLFSSFLAKKKIAAAAISSINPQVIILRWHYSLLYSTKNVDNNNYGLLSSFYLACCRQFSNKTEMTNGRPAACLFHTKIWNSTSATALTFLVGKNSAFGIPMPCLQNCFKVVFLKTAPKNVVWKYRRLPILNAHSHPLIKIM